MKRKMKPYTALHPALDKKGAGFLNNAGYTVLEMMVVVAMLAVGLAIVWMSVSTIFSLEMRECTKNIASELGKEKVAAMTRTGDVYMRLYKNSGGIYIDKYENDLLIEDEIKVGTAKLTVKYCSASNTSGTELDNTGIIISFNKNNGSFKNIGQSWALYDTSHSALYPSEFYSKIIVSSGNSARMIVLWPDTGKFTVTG